MSVNINKFSNYLTVEARQRSRGVFINFGELGRNDWVRGMQKRKYACVFSQGPVEDPGFILYTSVNSLHSITLNLPKVTKCSAVRMTALDVLWLITQF